MACHGDDLVLLDVQREQLTRQQPRWSEGATHRSLNGWLPQRIDEVQF
jgi:hypothetical protein